MSAKKKEEVAGGATSVTFVVTADGVNFPTGLVGKKGAALERRAERGERLTDLPEKVAAALLEMGAIAPVEE